MAFELALEVSENSGCQSWNFEDSTGLYSASTNTGGYGSPNVASSAITSATILVLQNGFATGYTFTFTIATNVITAATVTAPNGTITTITSDLTSTVFPFSEDEPFVIIADWLGFGEDSQFVSDAYYFEYNITNGVTTYTSSVDQLIVCQTCCCIRTMVSNLEDCNCDDKNGSLDKAVKAQMFYDSAIWSMQNGEADKSVNSLNVAKTLCDGNCAGCN